MNGDVEILRTAADLAEAGTSFVLVTVIKVQGSTPRDAGAKMIWKGGDDALVGTVGGGQFELLVLEAAQRHMKSRGSGIERYVLGAEAEQCCGGVMEVFFEYFGASRRLVIFGAGHVSRELAALVAGTAVQVVVVDDREEWANQERFPGCRVVTSWDDGVRLAQEHGPSTLACVMTCSHDRDYQLLKQLLSKPPAFVGLIGSKSKRVCLFGRLVGAGVAESTVTAVRCPIGVGDLGKEPRMVAISMAAQILLEAKKLPAM
ncbi:MAG: xanthine dehydrogenase accessory protein XdhC [Planctomycetes bacterium]|nr:xanthine dehydrogenase accessory protein XdhC [Planctomycetota bacterium]